MTLNKAILTGKPIDISKIIDQGLIFHYVPKGVIG